MAEKGSLFAAGMSATPWGAALGAATQIASTPNTSASGDVTTGPSTFGDINFGFNARQVPIAVWIAIAALATLYILRR